MRKKKRNPNAVALVLAVLVIGGLIVNGIEKIKERREEMKDERVLRAFDELVEGMTDTRFVNRELIASEVINNYATYADTDYVTLSRMGAMYISLMDFSELDAVQQKERIKEQEVLIGKLSDEGWIKDDVIRVEKEKLRLMKELDGTWKEQTLSEIGDEYGRVNRRRKEMEQNSPGLKYVVEAETKEGIRCRMILVASEENPYGLTMAGGDVIEFEENER